MPSLLQEWPGNPKLAQWVRGQRLKEKDNKLLEERRGRLVSAGFTFRSKSHVDRVFIIITCDSHLAK